MIVVSAFSPLMVMVPVMTGKPFPSRVVGLLSTEVRLYFPGARLIIFSSPFALAVLIAAIKPAASPDEILKIAEWAERMKERGTKKTRVK